MFSVLYRSVASADFTKEEIYKMLSLARDFNNANRITGCLLYHKGQFLQLIEGEEEQVTELFSRIQNDPRHTMVTTLETKTNTQRIFHQWDMAYHDFGEGGGAAYYKLQQIDGFFSQSDALRLPSETASTFFKTVRDMLLQVS